MFEETSRYYSLETEIYETADGRIIKYKKQRFLPQGKNLSLLVNVTVNEGNRLDLIAAQTIGDSEQFWRICDANNAMNPFDLTTEVGKTLRVPIPQFEDS